MITMKDLLFEPFVCTNNQLPDVPELSEVFKNKLITEQNPHIIITFGEVGAGKSTRANQLIDLATKNPLNKVKSPYVEEWFQTGGGQDPITQLCGFNGYGPIFAKDIFSKNSFPNKSVLSNSTIYIIDMPGVDSFRMPQKELSNLFLYLITIQQISSLTLYINMGRISNLITKNLKDIFIFEQAFSDFKRDHELILVSSRIGIREACTKGEFIDCYRKYKHQDEKITQALQNDFGIQDINQHFSSISQPDFNNADIYWKTMSEILSKLFNTMQNSKNLTGKVIIEQFENISRSLANYSSGISESTIREFFDKIYERITYNVIKESNEIIHEEIRSYLSNQSPKTLRRIDRNFSEFEKIWINNSSAIFGSVMNSNIVLLTKMENETNKIINQIRERTKIVFRETFMNISKNMSIYPKDLIEYQLAYPSKKLKKNSYVKLYHEKKPYYVKIIRNMEVLPLGLSGRIYKSFWFFFKIPDHELNFLAYNIDSQTIRFEQKKIKKGTIINNNTAMIVSFALLLLTSFISNNGFLILFAGIIIFVFILPYEEYCVFTIDDPFVFNKNNDNYYEFYIPDGIESYLTPKRLEIGFFNFTEGKHIKERKYVFDYKFFYNFLWKPLSYILIIIISTVIWIIIPNKLKRILKNCIETLKRVLIKCIPFLPNHENGDESNEGLRNKGKKPKPESNSPKNTKTDQLEENAFLIKEGSRLPKTGKK